MSAKTPYFIKVKSFYSVKFKESHTCPHRHTSEYEMMYITSGECQMVVDKKEYILKEGQFMIIKEKVFHQLTIQQGQSCHILNLQFMLTKKNTGIDVTEFFYQYPQAAKLFDLDYICTSDRVRLCSAMKDLIAEMESSSSDPYYQQVLCTRMLIELLRCYEYREIKTGIIYTRKATEYIATHFEDDLNVAKIAQAAGINDAYLQTLFKKQYGVSIITYLNTVRMQKAQFLLKNSNLKITTIAFACGFNSRQHFGYSFQKMFGLSPNEYRHKNNTHSSSTTKII